MDMQTLDVDIFLSSLTEEQMSVCEKDEEKLNEIVREGWSEEAIVRFCRAMICARRINPAATVEGVLELALRMGLSSLTQELTTPARKQNREDDAPTKRRKSGVRAVGGVRGV
jgi:hypothetical protein